MSEKNINRLIKHQQLLIPLCIFMYYDPLFLLKYCIYSRVKNLYQYIF